jgi:hypothetical protein
MSSATARRSALCAIFQKKFHKKAYLTAENAEKTQRIKFLPTAALLAFSAANIFRYFKPFLAHHLLISRECG